jgi:D-3-phosphoglycerate dehydrogenase
MRVLACDPALDIAYAQAHRITPVSLDKLVSNSDIVSLHLPLKDDTRHIISLDVMCNMKKGALLINTARGGLIDEAAACALLRSGHLGGMGLDVYEVEPPFDPALFSLDNVALTPHTAARTVEATALMATVSVQNLINVLSGKDCPYVVPHG